MKKIISLLFLLSISMFAQDNMNVLSYYASDNSLDGQPRIDMMNVIRFFPVFAIQDSVTEVNITIYYGNKIYYNKANRMEEGKYWQALLPEFKLGDALQRVEVCTKIRLSKKVAELLQTIDASIPKISDSIRDIARYNNKKIEQEIKSLTNLPWTEVLKATEILIGVKIEIADDSLNLKKLLLDKFSKETFFSRKNEQDRNDFFSGYIKLVSNLNTWNKLINLVGYRNTIIQNYQSGMGNIYVLNTRMDSIKQEIFTRHFGKLADTLFSGPIIRKSDLKISSDYQTAELLYRYYKNNLRYRKALDPAESLGIFRLRYVPFPIVGRPSDNTVQLLRPMQEKTPVVFEIGLAFGDEVVSGDNTFKPVLSLSRLGVAMVVSEKLFSNEADILGLALTYDFNSYASIGIGKNLAQGQTYPYYSFGINKKAFEELLSGIASIFK